jgi:RimJ/RimL family protein N-acetyltransferase
MGCAGLSLNAGLNPLQDWRNQPMQALDFLRQQQVLDTASPLHQSAILQLYGELALQQGLPIEAGWALYYSRSLSGFLPPPLQEALLQTHPLWHQPLRGHRVVLFRPQQRHRDFLIQTLGDADFIEKYNLSLGSASSAADGYVTRGSLPAEQLRQLDWVIETQTGVAIGLASIADLAFAHRRGEFLIGFPNPKISSLLTVEASLLVLALAFHELCLGRLVSYVYADNVKAQKATLDLGFSAEGRLRRHLYAPTKPDGVDLLSNGLLCEDYVANASLKVLYARLLPTFSHKQLFHLKLAF